MSKMQTDRQADRQTAFQLNILHLATVQVSTASNSNTQPNIFNNIFHSKQLQVTAPTMAECVKYLYVFIIYKDLDNDQ